MGLSTITKALNLDQVDLYDLFGNLFYISMIIVLIYYFIKMIYNIFKPFSFSDFGSEFDQEYFKFWTTKFQNNFGLKGDDHLDFIINIRTDDASDDCNIKGRYKESKMDKISIMGDGPKCKDLRINNKL